MRPLMVAFERPLTQDDAIVGELNILHDFGVLKNGLTEAYFALLDIISNHKE